MTFWLNCININENAETNCNYCFVDTEYYKSLIGCMSKVNCKKKHEIEKSAFNDVIHPFYFLQVSNCRNHAIFVMHSFYTKTIL